MTLYLYLGIAAVLMALGGYGVYKWQDGEMERLKQQAEQASEGAKVWEGVANDYKGDLDESQRIGALRANQTAASGAKLQAAQRELDSLRKTDKPVDDWAAASVPEPVRRLRRAGGQAPGGGEVQPSTGPATADPNPTPK